MGAREMIRSFVARVSGSETRTLRRQLHHVRKNATTAIQAATSGKGGWVGTRSNRNEDQANQDYLRNLGDVLQRSQDLDVNNPDVRGFHRRRTAQIVGSHVRFKAAHRPEEIGLSPDATIELDAQIDHIRHLHSRTGGFDSTGNNRSEGTQQNRAVLTALIHGSCLIHRVMRPENPILPLSLELIPGVRISTPNDKMGDPKISYGIEYSDEHRTRVVAYWVRRVAKTVGDSFVPDVTWDRLPAVDCSLLSLAEAAGMDRSMPISIACIRMLRNRAEFIEAVVESARAQAAIYGAVECAEGADPWNVAEDDADPDQTGASGQLFGFSDDGPVKLKYLPNGEKMNWMSAQLPQPDMGGFFGITDARLARGFVSSLSRFTGEVNNSWAGGRLEDQQDEPVVAGYQESFVSAWQRVNEWTVEAIWLSGRLALPGYSTTTAVYWGAFRAQFPGKYHINPQDTGVSREMGYAQRTLSPQQACEEDGKDLRENLRQWAEAMQIQEQLEKKHGLKPGSLAFLLTGKQFSTASGGDEIVPGDPEGGQAGSPAKKPRNGPRPTPLGAAAPSLRITAP